MSLLIISSSLNPDSKSRKMAQCALSQAMEQGVDATYLDLMDFPLQLCDGARSFQQGPLEPLVERIQAAQAILLAGPIYVYGMAAATRNLIELTGRAWSGKPVGLMAAAGGKSSYMAVLGIANSLMLDYRCPIVPRYVYTDSEGFDPTSGEVVVSIRNRIAELVKTTAHWGAVL